MIFFLTASISLASKVYPDCAIGDSGPGLCISEYKYEFYIEPKGSDADISVKIFYNGAATFFRGKTHLQVKPNGLAPNLLSL